MIRFCSVLLLSAGLLGAANLTHAAPRIEIGTSKSDTNAGVQLDVRDRWPDGCVPLPDKASVERNDITLRSTLPSPKCTSSQTGLAASMSESVQSWNLPPLRNGVYRVRYEIAAAPDALPEVHGFQLLDLHRDRGAERDATLKPETGFWWPEQGGEFGGAGPGIGVLMEAQSDTLSISVIGYGSDGMARWSYGAGTIQGRTLELELGQLADGAGPFDPYRAPKGIGPAGSVQIELLSSGRANLWFIRDPEKGRTLSVQPISMVRFRFAQETPEAWLGRWVVAAASGDTPQARHIDFVAVERDSAGFTLLDRHGEVELNCETASERPNSPPVRCHLIGAVDGAPLATFGTTALFEMRGTDVNNVRIVAIKLDR